MLRVDIKGQKFGKLTAIKPNGSKSGEGVLWLCECDCGNQTTTTAKNLRSGNTKSCGCINTERFIRQNKEKATHGKTSSPTFVSWDSMKQRVLNQNHKSYANYGGRGIKVCERWLESFENFFADMGERPDGMTLDRIDVDGNYEPTNCRWATPKTQSNNRSNNHSVEYKGVKKTITEWAAEIGISKEALRYRLNNGWTVEEALSMKLQHGNGWARGVRK